MTEGKKSALKYWQRRRKLSNVIVIETYYNFECDWLIELSVSNLASELVKIGFFFSINHSRGNWNFYNKRKLLQGCCYFGQLIM